MKIYLVGMPGSGKSTLGEQLARALDVQFLDLDTEIEKKEGKSIPQIFLEHGENYFRIVEAEKLRELAGSDNSFVLATGGGAPCFYNGMDTLNETGISVFLNVPISELIRRVSRNKDRPLLANEDIEKKMQTLLEKRLPVYKKASIVVDNPTLDSVLRHFRK